MTHQSEKLLRLHADPCLERPTKTSAPADSGIPFGGEPKKKRHLSAASRKKIADAQKKRRATLKATR